MKKIFVSFALSLIITVLAPFAYGESATDSTRSGDDAPADPRAQSVAGGGAGGLPQGATVGVSSTSLGNFPTGPMSLEPMGVDVSENSSSIYIPPVSTTVLHPQTRPNAINPRPERVILDRDQMLEAINAALNRTDLEMSIEAQAATIRILSIDLQNKTLHGKILESNKPILLIDR